MKKNTTFLIGAGFSYPAKIPIMRDLARDFPQVLKEEEKSSYDQLKILEPEIEKDFELLMEICHDLSRVPISLINKLTRCSFGTDFIDLEKLVKGAKVLESNLKDFLHQKCKIDKKKLGYLYPLMEWIKKTKNTVDIFSLNYDLVIETLCEEFYIPYTDGFLVNWDSKLFLNPSFQVNLYKLHGSFIWYQSELGESVKIPILDENGRINYLSKSEVFSMMVYPRREKREPFGELLRIFSEKLLTIEKLNSDWV